MPKKLSDLSEAGKEELAIALLLWKDFKSDGKMDIEVSKVAIDFAQMLGIYEQFNSMMPKLPPMKIVPRYQ